MNYNFACNPLLSNIWEQLAMLVNKIYIENCRNASSVFLFKWILPHWYMIPSLIYGWSYCSWSLQKWLQAMKKKNIHFYYFRIMCWDIKTVGQITGFSISRFPFFPPLWCWGLNRGPCAYKTSTQPPELYPQPSRINSYVVNLGGKRKGDLIPPTTPSPDKRK